MIWRGDVGNLLWNNCAQRWSDKSYFITFYIKSNERNCVLLNMWLETDYVMNARPRHYLFCWPAGIPPFMNCWDITSHDLLGSHFMICWYLAFHDLLGTHLSRYAGTSPFMICWISILRVVISLELSPSLNVQPSLSVLMNTITVHQICNTNDKLLEIETGAGTGYQITGPWG